MAKLKMLKLPTAPKLPKKPGANASLASRQAYIRKYNDLKQKHIAKVKAVEAENAQRQKENAESEKLGKVISGLGRIEVRPSGFKAVNIRYPRPGSKISGVSKKRKPVKKVAKKKATKRRR